MNKTIYENRLENIFHTISTNNNPMNTVDMINYQKDISSIKKYYKKNNPNDVGRLTNNFNVSKLKNVKPTIFTDVVNGLISNHSIKNHTSVILHNAITKAEKDERIQVIKIIRNDRSPSKKVNIDIKKIEDTFKGVQDNLTKIEKHKNKRSIDFDEMKGYSKQTTTPEMKSRNNRINTSSLMPIHDIIKSRDAKDSALLPRMFTLAEPVSPMKTLKTEKSVMHRELITKESSSDIFENPKNEVIRNSILQLNRLMDTNKKLGKRMSKVFNVEMLQFKEQPMVFNRYESVNPNVRRISILNSLPTEEKANNKLQMFSMGRKKPESLDTFPTMTSEENNMTHRLKILTKYEESTQSLSTKATYTPTASHIFNQASSKNVSPSKHLLTSQTTPQILQLNHNRLKEREKRRNGDIVNLKTTRSLNNYMMRDFKIGDTDPTTSSR